MERIDETEIQEWKGKGSRSTTCISQSRARAERRRGGASARSASQEALEAAQLATDQDLEKSPPSPPSRASCRAKMQKALNAERVVADLHTRLAAENATLKAQLEKERKRKQPSSVEAVNPKQRQPNVSNAITRKRQVVMFSLFDISLQSFQWLPFS
jgi:hypothetical protein